MNSPAAEPAVQAAVGELPAGANGRRHLALAFIDLSGSSRLAEALEAEQFAEILAAQREVCRRCVEPRGGRIIRLQGDGALAVFGYPEPAEDDCRRAVEAVLDAHAAFEQVQIAALPPALRPLRLHSGIHAGLVLLAEGDVERGRLDLIGDAPNTAARLAALAPAGALFVDLQSLGPDVDHFEVQPLGRLALPGRSLPVAAARVLRVAEAPAAGAVPARRRQTPFVGREALVQAVAERLARLPDAPAATVIHLRGEAGIGKTRLLDELARLPAAVQVLRGGCEGFLGAEVMQPIAQMARALDAAEPPAAGSARRSAAAGFVERVSRFAERRALLLLIDDWQWADDGSRATLDAIARLPRPILVVLAARPADDGGDDADHADDLRLGPLSLDEAGVSVARWLPDADPFTVAEIHAYAGGVPLLIEELCHSVAALGRLRGSVDRVGRSGWFAGLVGSRLARLPAAQQQVLRVAAVLGNAFPTRVLAQVVGLAPDALDLPALAEADFLFGDERGEGLRFKHGLTRDAVYDSIGLAERTALHLRVLSVLSAAGEAAGDDGLEARAHHARAAGRWDDALGPAEAAGDKAMAAFALDRARGLYLAAMDCLDRREAPTRADHLHWCKLAHKLGMTCIFDSLALPDSLAIFERALQRARLAGDEACVARSHYWLGYIAYGLGQPSRALAHGREALRLARQLGDERLAAQVEATLGQVLIATCDYDEALGLIDDALHAKQQRARLVGGTAVGSAFTLACRASVFADRGDFEQAHADFEQVLRLLGDSTHPVANSVRNWLVVVLCWQGRWAEARSVARQSMQLAATGRALMPLAIARVADGWASWMGSGSERGYVQMREAVGWMEQRRALFYTSIYYGWLAEADVARGRPDDARRHAARLLRRVRVGEVLGEADGRRALALLHAQGGRFDSARGEWRRATAAAERRRSRREQALNELCLARLLRHRGEAGDADAAATALRRALDGFQAMGMTWHAEQAAATGAALPPGLPATAQRAAP